MKSLFEIREILRSHKSDLEQRYGIGGLWVFGSVVRGEASEDSDIDLLATFSGGAIGLLGLLEVEYYLSELLGSKVDVIPWDEIRAELQEQIYREAVPV
jgi:predicted nucleotidyltransferase